MSSSPSPGSQASGLAAALISSSFDKEPQIKEAISESLSTFGRKSPELVLDAIHSFLVNHPKIDQNHRILLLHCINNILQETCSSITSETAKKLITIASEDLTKAKKATLELHSVASDILVSAGMYFLSEVMEELLKKFVPGILPHSFVVQTLGKLSVANVNGMAAYMGKLLSTTLPLLSLAKTEVHRVIFSKCLTNFCESILEFVANDNTEGENQISKTTFSTEIYGAYDILYTSWLQTRDTKVVCAVVGALGKMCHLMEVDKLEVNAPKLVSMLISLSRRHTAEPFAFTSALCETIAAVTAAQSNVLEQNIDGLTVHLHNQVWNTPENASNILVKNYNEVLRCFGILATGYSEIIIRVILQRAESRDERVKAGNLVILRHLINSNAESMDQHKDLIVTGFLGQLNETSNKVKMSLGKLIIAMATHGFLECEGGQEYVQFIIRQCSLTVYQQVKDKSVVTNEQVRTMCDDILKLITTTVEGLEKVLWPYLFELVINLDLSNALGVIFCSLAHIAQKKREEKADDFIIDFNHTVNIPSPVPLFSRMLVSLAHPHNPRSHTHETLLLLQHFSPNIHNSVVEVWDEIIPKIIQHLQDNIEDTTNWSQTTWEDLLLKFLQRTVDEVNNEEWICSVGQSLTSQWSLYEFEPAYKNFAYKCLGVVLRKTQNKEFVESYLATLFLSIKHNNQLEREGSAVCVGYCASSHLDATLSRVAEFTKQNITKKESSYFTFLKSEKSLVDLEKTKGLVALCCGYIAFYGPSQLITSRIETNIVKTIVPLFKGIKDPVIRGDIATSVNLIARSLDPDHFTSNSNKPRYIFAAREDFVTRLMTYMKDDIHDKPSFLKAAIMKACASLVKLDPPIADSDIAALVKQCMGVIVPIPEPEEEHKDHEIYQKCVHGLYDLLEEIIRKKPNSTGLFSVFRHLEPFLMSSAAHERKQALLTVHEVFKSYYNLFKVSNTNSDLSHLGVLLAHLIPCCCDDVPEMRQSALNCIQQLLDIQNKYNGVENEGHSLESSSLAKVSTQLQQVGGQLMYTAIVDLAQILCRKIPSELLHFQQASLTVSLFDSLSNQQGPAAYGACLTLHHIFESRGTIFVHKIEDIMSILKGTLAEVSVDGKPPYVKDGVLNLFSCLVRHHAQACIKSLLSSPLPYTDVVKACWWKIGSTDIRTTAIELLLDLYDRSLPYEEVLKRKGKPKEGSTKTATSSSLAITCAIQSVLEMHENPQKSDLSREKISYHLFAMAMVRVGSMIDVQSPPKLGIDPYIQAVDLLRTVLVGHCDSTLQSSLEQRRMWSFLDVRTGDTFLEALSAMAGSFCKHRLEDVSHLVSSLNLYLPSMYEMKRATVVGFFAQLVCEPAGRNDVLLEIIMNGLRSKLVDGNTLVRQLCIRGLANIIFSSQEQIERYSTSVLSAMMTGMDDKDDPNNAIALEAMSGLAKFLDKVERTNIHSIFINVCLRVRPCFENDNPVVRVAAFRLFGALSKFGIGSSEASYVEQVHSNLISILLHLNDENVDVIKSCKKTLREIGPHIGANEIDEVFQKHLLEDMNLHYGEFMSNLSKIMVTVFPEKVNFYVMGCVSFYKSQWPKLRCNAAMFTGFLMTNLDEEHRETMNKEHACRALVQLLKDSSPEVRGKAAEAISQLVQY